jgi:hypothetical protein
MVAMTYFQQVGDDALLDDSAIMTGGVELYLQDLFVDDVVDDGQLTRPSFRGLRSEVEGRRFGVLAWKQANEEQRRWVEIYESCERVEPWRS